MSYSVDQINDLFLELKMLPADVSYADHIRFFMIEGDVSFAELNFTEEELEEEERRALIGYINNVFVRLRNGAEYPNIHSWMNRGHITFAELNFTEEELEEEEQKHTKA